MVEVSGSDLQRIYRTMSPFGAHQPARQAAPRETLLRLLLDSRQRVKLDAIQYAAVMAELSSMAEPEPSNLALADDTQALQDFLDAKPSTTTVHYKEFLARKDVQRSFQKPGRRCAIYEFSWGFITEEYGVFNLYAVDIWRAGTVDYFEHFVTAWEALAVPELRRATARAHQDFYVSAADGSGVYGCISLACVLDAKGQRLARNWLAQEFLPVFWLQMLALANDRDAVSFQ